MSRQWETLKEYSEIKYEFYEGIAKITINRPEVRNAFTPVSYTHLRAHETREDLVCRLLLEKKKKKN